MNLVDRGVVAMAQVAFWRRSQQFAICRAPRAGRMRITHRRLRLERRRATARWCAQAIAAAAIAADEVSILSSHLLQNCMVYVNTLMLQQVLAQPHWTGRLTSCGRSRR
jgi:hypothetical protein